MTQQMTPELTPAPSPKPAGAALRKVTVLCTLPMDPAGAAMLEDVAEIRVAPDQSAQSLYDCIGSADILVVRSQLPTDLFERPNKLIGVVRHGTGLDLIPVESATAHGIVVANVPGANSQAVVEYCIGAFLTLARRYAQMDRLMHSNGWLVARKQTELTSELAGKTVGIIGLGNIGTGLANVCKQGFGMRVLGYAPNVSRIPSYAESVSLDQLFSESDYISLNCPLNASTRHLVDARRLGLMKPGAFIVNASRGAVIDEAALAEALARKQIGGAAIDVFVEQPLHADHPFMALENVLLTPHAAALTRESSEKMGVGTARQILQLLAGEQPENMVNTSVWQSRRKLATS